MSRKRSKPSTKTNKKAKSERKTLTNLNKSTVLKTAIDFPNSTYKSRIKNFIKQKKYKSLFLRILTLLGVFVKVVQKILTIVMTIGALFQIFVVLYIVITFFQNKSIIPINFLKTELLIICFIIFSLLSTIYIITSKENNKYVRLIPSLVVIITLVVSLFYYGPKILLDDVIKHVNNLSTKYPDFDKSTLLSYFGALIGSIVAVIGAFVITYSQIMYQKKTQAKEECDYCRLIKDFFLRKEINNNLKNIEEFYCKHKDLLSSEHKYVYFLDAIKSDLSFKPINYSFVNISAFEAEMQKNNLFKYNNHVVKEILDIYEIFYFFNSINFTNITEVQFKELILNINKLIEKNIIKR